ncbi:YusG family protein [Bacillus atrophaeus]|uniref:YusG family protein n=1 Tax=Bacillus atrophaeus TaxID=1452 RepID=UPI001EFA5608|nr:YusG family protein [Bacillus atrophaeus]MCG8397103.1 YusG family protein [Bacillus atrophaeus]
MAISKQRFDVTDHVTGRFQDGRLSLYHEDEMIGQMTGMNEYELKPGFSFENEKFYKTADAVSGSDAKYVDCDYENGWC